MFRWYIIRTLIVKEILRYRYNWGLLVVVFALLALSGLVALGSKFQSLPGQGAAAVNTCYVFSQKDDVSKQWVAHLREHPPQFPHNTVFLELDRPDLARVSFVRIGTMNAELVPPPAPANATANPEGWTIRYWHGDTDSPGILPYREWLSRESQAYLHASPRLNEETNKGTVPIGTEALERLPIIVASLALFALYLLSFNLFITSTGEEREKRVLLALMLSPASPQEVLAAKAIFYAASSLIVSLAVVGMYSPVLLLRPMLWLTVIFGSVGYVAIGTVVLSIVRRQTTINTLSMLYLIVTSIIMMLSQFLPPFGLLKLLLIENYLYAQMKRVVADQQHVWLQLNQAALGVIVLVWCLVALRVFRRHATSIARAR